MKRLLLFTISSGLVFVQFACKPNQQKTESVSSAPTATSTPALTAARPSGPPTETIIGDVRIVNYTNTGGRQPKVGEVAIAYVANWVGDSMLISSRQRFGGPMPMPMQETKKVTDGPLMYAIARMGLGDSISVFRPIDADIMSILSPRLKKEKIMRADIVLVDIKDAKDVTLPPIVNIHK